VDTQKADAELDRVLARTFADASTLEHLLDASLRDASPSAAELGHGLTLLANRRARVQDDHERGIYSDREAEKRLDNIAGEQAPLEAMVDVQEPLSVESDVLADVVEVFGSWDALQRHDKRALLRDYGVEIVALVAGEPKRGKRRLEVERIRLDGLPAHVWLYKKLKRLGIE